MKQTAIIAVANQKGGEGKTTTAVNIAFGMAHKGKKTLLLDMDPQSNSSGIFIDPDSINSSVCDLFNGTKKIEQVIISTGTKNLDLVPAHITLAEMEAIGANVDAPYLIRDALQKVKKSYDFIIIDCPPSLSVFTINALVAATHVVIPAQAEKFSIDGMKGLQNTINSVKRRINPGIEILGAVITQSKKQTVLHKTVLPVLSEYFPVFKSTISTGVVVGESHLARQSIYDYAPDSKQAAEYKALLEEILNELEN